MKKIDFVDGKFTTEKVLDIEVVNPDRKEEEQEAFNSPKLNLPVNMSIIQSKEDKIFIRLDVNGWAQISKQEAIAIINSLGELVGEAYEDMIESQC